MCNLNWEKEMMIEKILDKFVKFLFMIKKKYIICKLLILYNTWYDTIIYLKKIENEIWTCVKKFFKF